MVYRRNMQGDEKDQQLLQARRLTAAGMQRHAVGDLTQAAALYAQALEIDPEQADAAHYAGVAALQQEGGARAHGLLTRAVVLRPAFAEALVNLSGALIASHDYRRAVACAARALRLSPIAPIAWNNLGQALRGAGDFAAAAGGFIRALELSPGFPQAENNLAETLLLRAERSPEDDSLPTVIELLRRALALQPSRTATAHKLVCALDRRGEALRRAGMFDAAAACFEAALRLAPGVSEARYHLGLTRLDQGRAVEAEALLRETLRRDPAADYARLALARLLRNRNDAAAGAQQWRALARQVLAAAPANGEALYLLGLETLDDGVPETGEPWWRRTAALEPATATVDVYCNLGHARHAQGRLQEAEADYRKAAALDPAHVLTRWNLGLARLARGDYRRGWRLYETRRELHGVEDIRRPEPLWRGEDSAGKSILLYAEQGLGDSIQFSRYAALIRRKGARVTLLCQPALQRLFTSLAGVDLLAASGEDVPICDYRAPLLSLPALLETDATTIPAAVPYLSADAGLCDTWRRRLTAVPGRKIGLIWRSASKNSRARTMTAQDWAPLLRLQDHRFIGLQKDMPAQDAAFLQGAANFTDISADLHDFTDTAGAMAALDLVISIDTAGLHLAGALGRPAWAALPFSGEWRWGLSDRTPWYSGMRLFRQPTPGDWAAVTESMAAALAAGL
jgi:tetratricopeptide (TPR) repeat protein